MIERNLPLFNFQTFYLSKEESNCPLIYEIIRVGKKLKDLNLKDKVREITISLRYGKRILINAKENSFEDLKKGDILEIVDYDPIKKIILTIGQKSPKIDTPVHWILHQARDDINAIIQIDYNKLDQKFYNILPITENETKAGTLEQAKEILKQLRNSKRIIIRNQGLIFAGKSIKGLEETILETLEE
jgi:ribulose-5-phosphate 4-epimerase/fuculose-1-phosphate aldolase